MFHPRLVSKAVRTLESAFSCDLVEHTADEIREWTGRLADAIDEKGKPARPQTQEEQQFIRNELLMTKASFEYWATRYAKINVAGAGLGSLFPLLDSQEFVLSRLAELELAAAEGGLQEGIFVNILKAARQVGVSTLAEAIGAHRFTTQNHIFGMIAGAAPEGASYLFGMFERYVENLPWWLRPRITDHVKNVEMAFDGGAHIWVGAGKNMAGSEGQRGQLGRGKTLSFCHLTELSTWENPDQIDDALMPAFPKAPRTFVLFESTAKGKGNWWEKHWILSKKGLTDPKFAVIYIPWYVERKYATVPPEGWQPKPETLAYATKVEDLSERWAGRRVRLLRSQMYWYEVKRASLEEKGKLKEFLEEFGSIDDEECFQHSGHSVIPLEVQQAFRDRARPIAGVFEVRPMREIRG